MLAVLRTYATTSGKDWMIEAVHVVSEVGINVEDRGGQQCRAYVFTTAAARREKADMAPAGAGQRRVCPERQNSNRQGSGAKGGAAQEVLVAALVRRGKKCAGEATPHLPVLHS